MKPKIKFTKGAIPFLLEALGRTIDSEGYIINKETGDFQLNQFGLNFKVSQFIGIINKNWYSN